MVDPDTGKKKKEKESCASLSVPGGWEEFTEVAAEGQEEWEEEQGRVPEEGWPREMLQAGGRCQLGRQRMWAAGGCGRGYAVFNDDTIRRDPLLRLFRARAVAIIGGERPGDAPSGTSKSGLKWRRGRKTTFSSNARQREKKEVRCDPPPVLPPTKVSIATVPCAP